MMLEIHEFSEIDGKPVVLKFSDVHSCGNAYPLVELLQDNKWRVACYGCQIKTHSYDTPSMAQAAFIEAKTIKFDK